MFEYIGAIHVHSVFSDGSGQVSDIAGIADETGLSINDPFIIKKWELIDDQKVIIMQIRIKKRKAGFLESGVQLGAYLGTSNFI